MPKTIRDFLKEEALTFPRRRNLSGAEIISALRKGHLVRRKAWRYGYFIRICNEHGYDINGNAIVNDSPIYTLCTDGYFMHLAYSNQPLRNYNGPRGSEGVNMLFEDDWEDYGFIDRERFDVLMNNIEKLLRAPAKKMYEKWMIELYKRP